MKIAALDDLIAYLDNYEEEIFERIKSLADERSVKGIKDLFTAGEIAAEFLPILKDYQERFAQLSSSQNPVSRVTPESVAKTRTGRRSNRQNGREDHDKVSNFVYTLLEKGVKDSAEIVRKAREAGLTVDEKSIASFKGHWSQHLKARGVEPHDEVKKRKAAIYRLLELGHEDSNKIAALVTAETGVETTYRHVRTIKAALTTKGLRQPSKRNKTGFSRNGHNAGSTDQIDSAQKHDEVWKEAFKQSIRNIIEDGATTNEEIRKKLIEKGYAPDDIDGRVIQGIRTMKLGMGLFEGQKQSATT